MMATKTKTTTVKKTSTRTRKVVPTAELYIVNGGEAKFDKAHGFKKSVSPIYGVEEYSWTGKLTKGEVKFVRPTGTSVPTNNIYNSGITLIGKALHAFSIHNALVVTAEGSCDQIITYGNPDTKLEYVGDEEVHTVYVRVYDNANGGDLNDRWIALSID